MSVFSSQIPVQYCSLQHWAHYFHHQIHPQLGIISLLAQLLYCFWSCFSFFLSSILETYQPGGHIFQCHIFLPFHTVHSVLKERMLKWFAIPFSTGQHFVRPWLAGTWPSAAAHSWMTFLVSLLSHCWSLLSVQTFTGPWMLVSVTPGGLDRGSAGVTGKGFRERLDPMLEDTLEWRALWHLHCHSLFGTSLPPHPQNWGHPGLFAAIGMIMSNVKTIKPDSDELSSLSKVKKVVRKTSKIHM